MTLTLTSVAQPWIKESRKQLEHLSPVNKIKVKWSQH